MSALSIVLGEISVVPVPGSIDPKSGFLGMGPVPDEPDQQSFDDGEALLLEEAKPKLKRPPLYKVLLLNDDYTPMDFVVAILQGYFSMPHEKAVQVMMNVHQRGIGVCGVYPREVAETKVDHVMREAREAQHPLQCVMEPESDDNGED